MSVFLKGLYNCIVDTVQDVYWYKAYVDAIKRTSLRAKEVNAGKPITSSDDYDFLKEFIYVSDNGVASAPMSMLHKDNFEKLISDSSFLDCLNAYVKEPNADNYDGLMAKWNEVSKANKFNFVKTKANRFAAAFNQNLSTVADEGKFNEVYDWFISHNLFAGMPDFDEEKGTWFTRNERIISLLRKVFDEELRSGETDETWLSMFVWYLWERFVSNPYRIKKQVVKYGPPGTGKTYTAKRDANREIAIWKADFNVDDEQFSAEHLCMTVQFHPSFGYEDFMEGLRPVKASLIGR